MNDDKMNSNQIPLVTVSRISWKTQLEHAPTLFKDLADIGINCTNHRHVMINTFRGLKWLVLEGRKKPVTIAVLDAIPLLPFIIKIMRKPTALLSTYGDRHVHVLFEKYPFTGWILDLAEWVEKIDAKASDMVKSSGKEALDYIASKVEGPQYVYIPDEFHPFEKKSEILLYQGNLRWDKGVEQIIDLIRDSADKVLIIIGDGPHRRKLEKYARKIGVDKRVVFTGFQMDPEPFWRMADTIVANRKKSRANEFAVPGLKLRAAANNKPCITI